MNMREQIQEMDNQLLAAARDGNLFALKGALLRGAALTAADPKKRNVAHLAAAGGHVQILEFLAEEPQRSKVDFEARDESQSTPLLIAFEYGKPGAAQWLMDFGVELMAVDKNGDGILRKAAKQRTDIGKDMLQLALKVDDALDNTCTDFGWSALHTMVEMHNMSGMELALLCGADPRLKGTNGDLTPRQVAEMDNLHAEAALLQAFEELPRLPEDLSKLTLASLLEPNQHGHRLLDNPRTWRKMEKIMDVLESKGEALPCKEDLLRPAVLNYSPMALALLNNRLDLAHEMMDAHGERLQSADFWTKDQAGISMFGRVAIDQGLVADLFTVERWTGEDVRHLKEAYRAMPPEVQDAVPNWHVLQATISRESHGLQREK